MDRLPANLRTHLENKQKQWNPHFMAQQMALSVPEKERLKESEYHFMNGDRVQLKDGKDAGKIGKVVSIFKEGNAYYVEGVGEKMRTVLPREFWVPGQSLYVSDFPQPIKQDRLRLVVDMKDGDQSREVAIHTLSLSSDLKWNDDYKKPMPIRMVKHNKQTIEIPWPPAPEPVDCAEVATPADIARERTWFVENLLQSPIPKMALGDVRNPLREYKAKVVRKNFLEKWNNRPTMPLSETKKAQLAEKATKAAEPKFHLSKEVEEFIYQKVENYHKQFYKNQ
ncbi:hypothetical protein NADFUDRAFT_29028 [Nadsonia fulvescens var. elongata DSM 6958]|uniref:KOW domain-containing protein n=1 Tax=Nadsonia fulvescens var. elongata DSM 6958 TaxID=857566 RepID=A0A1E3PD05_9ASCO|nr:hypothetical protein NADFUDRAFT_29028 [Nadsonia fulvescens var. elongata DSM 6958]